MKPFAIIAVCLLLALNCTVAQEIDCEITTDVQRLTTAETRDNLSDFVQQLKQYVNTYTWTKEDFGNEKIKCTFNISFQGSVGDNHYITQVFIGSQRPVYKLGQNTAVTRIMDANWEFDYIRNQAFSHNDSRFDPLLSFIDFYIYLILGYDADTYHTNGGTAYFQKAMEIVNQSHGASSSGKGWELSPQGSYTRAQVIDELLNPKYQDYRKAVHVYYYRGLDSLYRDPEKALKKMYSALEKIGKLRVKNNHPIVVLKTFFDTKYLEIAEKFLKDPDPSIYAKLSKIDPAHQQTYDEYAVKPR